MRSSDQRAPRGDPGNDAPIGAAGRSATAYAVKIHLLHLLRGTPLADEYQSAPFPLLEKEEYVQLVCDQLELLPPEVVIERITGDGEEATLLAPLWSLKKRRVMNAIDKEMARRNSWQGKGRETK